VLQAGLEAPFNLCWQTHHIRDSESHLLGAFLHRGEESVHVKEVVSDVS
jgi:hypothetical protein